MTFDSWIGREDELRESMIESHKKDKRVLFERGYFILPWSNDDVILEKDQLKLMQLIADEGGIDYQIDEIRDYLGFRSSVNARAPCNRIIEKGYVEVIDGWLYITRDGWAALKAAEYEAALFGDIT